MSVPHLGDINEDQEIVFCWDTNDSNGASVTRATDGTIKVRRNDGTDCTGTSVTDTEDAPDTGIHECKVDTSDGANYATGYDYTVWLDGAVIDGQTVNAVLAMFSIENRHTEAGGGSISWTITIDDGSDPLEGVQVWITTDEAGTDVIASGVTDTLGQVTFYLDAGTYYCWKQLAGFSFTNPESMAVA